MRDWWFPAVLLLCVGAAVVYFGVLPTNQPRPRHAAPSGNEQPASGNEQPANEPERDEAPSMTIEQLRAACIEEIKQRRMPRYNEPTACHRYEDLTRGTLPATSVAPVAPAAPATPAPAAPAEESPYATIPIDECTSFRRGSIEYRDCRHRESERIRRECAQKTWQADQASGAARQRLRREAAAYCREQSRYRPVD